MEWQLRPALSADRDFLFDLHRQALGPCIERVWGWDEEEQRLHLESVFDSAGWQVIVLHGRDVGMIRTPETEDRVMLDDIEILPAFQGRGLGTTVVRAVLDYAEGRGKDTALQVLTVNPARRLYQRLGFRVIGQDEVHIRMLHGRGTAQAGLGPSSALEPARLP